MTDIGARATGFDLGEAKRVAVPLVLVLLALAAALHLMGRVPYCTCGNLKLWHGQVMSSENSQHLFDWYTPSHVIHGFLFFAGLHVLMPKASFGTKLLLAVGIEAAWEVFENTDYTINRYRSATISLDYFGDSIVNSLFDVVAMLSGFFLAARLPVLATVGLAVAAELFVGYMIRDNLTLNVIMLIHPVDWIKAWQAGA